METHNVIIIVTSLIGAVGTVVTVGLFISSGVFKLGTLKKQVDQNKSDIEKVFVKIDQNTEKIFAKKEKVDQNTNDISNLYEKIDKNTEKIFAKIDKNVENISVLKIDVAAIKSAINTHFNQKPAFETQSPLRLTDYGNEIAKSIEADKIIKENWELILKEIKKKGTSAKNNLYDIQETCFAIGDNSTEIISKEALENIKKHAFKKGENLWVYNRILGLLIRDKFLKENNLEI